MNGLEQFRDFAAGLGYELPPSIEPGRRFRFSTNGKRGDAAGWGILFADGLGGVVGDWRSGQSETWQAKRGRLSAGEYRDLQTKIDRERREAQGERERDADIAAALASQIWESSKAASADHRYLKAKNVHAFGLRVYSGSELVTREGKKVDVTGALILPLRNAEGVTRSLEFIREDGAKLFLPESSYRGCYYAIGQPGDVITICEGFSTGATIHKETGYPVRIAAAAGNLEEVAKAIRAKAPEARLIVCADNDRQTVCPKHKQEGVTITHDPFQHRPEWCRCNPGVTYGLVAARAASGLLAIPTPEAGTDFNDLHTEGGDVKAQVNAAKSPPMNGANTASVSEIDAQSARPGATAAELAKLPRIKAPIAAIPATSPVVERSHPEIDPAAFYGLAGEIVRTIEPDTESDPVAILAQTLVAFGALVGRGPHCRVEADEHHPNLYAILCGATSKARKGTSWGRVHEFFSTIPEWPRMESGLSSGEGLKYAVRDPVMRPDKDKITGTITLTEADPGITDKRLLVKESEFAQAIKQASRPGNVLSAVVREAWDTSNLRTLTKTDQVTATGAHICIIGHITADELRAELSATDTANGFANRFLFIAARRSKVLPFGGEEMPRKVVEGFTARLRAAATHARGLGVVSMTPAARSAWAGVYPVLSESSPGLYGSVTGRAEAQVLRLSLVYALLDNADQVDVPHLMAALALWEYCAASAAFIFGDALGDPVADDLLSALRVAGSAGMTRTQIRDHFGRNQRAERIAAALELLRGRRFATVERRTGTGGAPVEVWKAGR